MEAEYTIGQIHGSDIGSVIIATISSAGVVANVSDASDSGTKELVFRDPSENLLTKNAVFTTNGTDGKIQYTSVAGDFDEAGRWRIQAHISDADEDYFANVGEFTVLGNLP